MKILILLGIFLLSVGISQIYASPISYDETDLNLTWNTVGTNPLIFDANEDGVADSFYTYSIVGATATITKVLGDGNTTTNNVTLGGATALNVNVDKDTVFFGSVTISGSTNDFYLSAINITSNVATNDILTPTITQTCDTSSIIIGGYATSGEPSYLALCKTSTELAGNTIQSGNATHIWFSDLMGGCCLDTKISVTPYSILAKDTNNIVRMVTFDKRFFEVGSITNLFGSSSVPFLSAYPSNYLTLIGQKGIFTTDISLSGNITPISTITIPTAKISGSVQMSFMGFATYTDKNVPNGLLKYNNLVTQFDSSTNDGLIVAFMPYKALDSTLTTDVPRFGFTTGGNNYVGYISGATVKYALLPDLSDRAFGSLFFETVPSSLDKLLTTNYYLTYPYSLITPSITYNQNFTNGQITLISGYNIKPDTTINRHFDIRSTDTKELIPVIRGNTTLQESLSFIVKNSPTSSGVKLEDTLLTLSGTPYVWTIGRLQADKSFSVDLDANKCVNIFIRDISFADDTWNKIGELCNSGAMPKTIVYSDNLSFTFWTLPYGVSHSFTQDTSSLSTKVRHDTLPFDYTVEIYDSDGVLQYDNTFTENSTSIDLQTINATGIGLPALLRVFDGDGNQIYYSTIGTPGYFSGTVAWFAQHLTIQGFNLLFMLPLVFGAMFTRNTVGVGTMITVVFIATLTWLGIIPLPDIAIYLMVFIGIIGIIAYKKLYD